MHCKIPLFLANSMMTYMIASIIYLLITFLGNYGTPFKDALKSYPELQKIQCESSSKRKQAFLIGVIIGFLFVFMFKPFQDCYKNINCSM
jgi:hypothetical protein